MPALHKHWPLIITGISSILIIIFLISMVLTYGPIVGVEATYQYHKTLHEVFHVNDLRSLILPQFHFDFETQTHYANFGMTIPSLYLDEPVIPNVDPTDKNAYLPALKRGIAHAAGTQVPGAGGLGYYFAHSSLPDLRDQYNAVFYLLGKLQPDDEVDIWYEGQKYAYSVTEKKETAASDVSFLQQKYPQETIVLQTCWPPGTTQRRLLVFAKRK